MKNDFLNDFLKPRPRSPEFDAILEKIWCERHVSDKSRSCSYLCVWTKKRFDDIVRSILQEPNDNKCLELSQIKAIKSWLEAGEGSTHKESVEWKSLKCYIQQTLSFLRDCGRASFQNHVCLEPTYLSVDEADEILGDSDPFDILRIERVVDKDSFSKARIAFIIESMGNPGISVGSETIQNSSDGLMPLAAAFAIVRLFSLGKERQVTEEEFRKILNDPPQHVVDLAKDGGSVQLGELEFLTIKKEGE